MAMTQYCDETYLYTIYLALKTFQSRHVNKRHENY